MGRRLPAVPNPLVRPARRGSTPSFTPRVRLALLGVGAAAVATIRSARAAHAAAREREAARPAAQPGRPRGSARVTEGASARERASGSRRSHSRASPDEIPTPAVLPPHAHFAAPWVGLVGSDAQASAFDPSRVAFAGDTATVWVRTQFPRAVPTAVTGRPGVRALDMPYEVRCAAGRARATGSMVLLGAAGDTLGERRAWDPHPWEPLDPALAKVCHCLACARQMRARRPAGNT